MTGPEPLPVASLPVLQFSTGLLPTLLGGRALSVFMVLLVHAHPKPFMPFADLGGGTGDRIYFVISRSRFMRAPHPTATHSNFLIL